MLEKTQNLIIIVLVVVVVGLLYLQFGKSGLSTSTELSSKEATDIALAFINENILAQGVEAKLAGEVKEENGLYRFDIEIEGQKYASYITKDGKILFPQGGIDMEKAQEEIAEQKETVQETTTLGGFSVSKDEVCQENGKPIIYFFGSEGCPHCQWEHPVFEAVVERFGDYIVFHNNIDTGEDMDVFSRYSTGGIPAMVLGCRYYRVGSGARWGEEEESKNLTALVCKLTNNQPATVCSEVADLVESIK